MLSNRAILQAALAATLVVAGCGGPRAERDASTPSGFAVPRYLVLRFDEINGRAGPSEDHAILWTYRAKGLPVQVIAETEEWRRICDPEGGISWVHSRMLEGGRTVIRMDTEPVAVHRGPNASSAVITALPPKATARLERCEDGWCKIKAGARSGWTQQSAVWGAAEGAQCAGLPAPTEPLFD
jgi:SH3-like domain-containing protein